MSEEKYNKFIESINIIKIDLSEMMCNQNKKFSAEKRSALDIGIEHEVKEVEFDGIEMTVKILFQVQAFNTDWEKGEQNKGIESISSEDILFKIHFVLDLTYSIEIDEVEDISTELESEVKTFVERNVPINAWPYARELVSSVTTRMGFPALVIPPYKNIPLL